MIDNVIMCVVCLLVGGYVGFMGCAMWICRVVKKEADTDAKQNCNKSVTDKTLARLRQQGVDISGLYEVIAALESEIRHQRKVILYMERQLGERKVTPAPDLFETGRLAGLLCLRDRMCRIKEKYTSENDAVGITLCNMVMEIIDIEIERER